MTPAVDRVVRCALRQPSDAQVAALLADGWALLAGPRRLWVDPLTSDALTPWAAWRRCAADRARNAGGAA